MKGKLEYALLGKDAITKRTGAALVKNSGAVIAAITVTLAILLTFTDVTFSYLGSREFTSNLILMLIASYLMYFSLEDSGEKLGEESAEYAKALERYEEIRAKIDGKDVQALRDFCVEYSKEELIFRRRNLLISEGLCDEEYERWQRGEKFSKRSEKIFKRASKLKAIALSPSILLSKEGFNKRSEISNPEKRKTARLIAKLIPTTLCMTVTVSVMLTMKDGLSAAAVIEGLLKLSTLPIIGFRGYSEGYSYIKNSLTPWIETKGRLLSAFIEGKMKYATD